MRVLRFASSHVVRPLLIFAICPGVLQTFTSHLQPPENVPLLPDIIVTALRVKQFDGSAPTSCLIEHAQFGGP